MPLYILKLAQMKRKSSKNGKWKSLESSRISLGKSESHVSGITSTNALRLISILREVISLSSFFKMAGSTLFLQDTQPTLMVEEIKIISIFQIKSIGIRKKEKIQRQSTKTCTKLQENRRFINQVHQKMLILSNPCLALMCSQQHQMQKVHISKKSLQNMLNLSCLHRCQSSHPV